VIAAAGLVGVVALSGVATLTRYDSRKTGSIRYALLQANDQDRELTFDEIRNDYLMQRHLDLAADLRGPYDLIVFPESSLERDPTQFDYVREALVGVARAHGAVVLANARTSTPDGGIANSNLAYRPDGELEGIYSKQQLVPFGEYVPWRDSLSFIGELDQIPYDYERGTKRVVFRTAGHDFATLICFESAFSPLARDFVRDGAELIVVTTNNRSYRRSGLAAQHLALSQMRAAETARPVLHASISGITGVIDSKGGVHDTSELFVNKITSGTIQARTGETPFVRFGEWVLGASMLALLAVAIISRSRRPRDAAVDS
jgi:apolipoprotein N-acyltransferase